MIRHVFRMMWNRKRRNLLVIVEIFVSFLVLFVVSTMMITAFVQYLRPLGFDTDNLWIVNLRMDNEAARKDRTDVTDRLEVMERELRTFPEVRGVTWTVGNHPYAASTWITTIDWEGRNHDVDIFPTDDSYDDVMHMPLSEGRWFDREDDGASYVPVVINGKMRTEFFGDGPAVGRTVVHDSNEFKVVGVVDEYRYHGEFEEYRAGLFMRNTPESEDWSPTDVAIVSVNTPNSAMLEKKVVDRLNEVVPDWTPRIENLAATRRAYLRNKWMSLGILAVVCGFLVLNVALGLFGVLWYSINRRRGEIGLRRALGAHAGSISAQIVGESMALTTLGVAVALLLAIQVPILGIFESASINVFFLSVLVSLVILYGLVALCAVYPSRLAARIQPAVALHDE